MILPMADSTTKALAITLRQFRERKSLSRQELADLAGVHHNTIQKLENAERTLTVQWIDRLAPHLGITREAFMLAAGKGETAEKFPAGLSASETVIPLPIIHGQERWPRDLPVLGIGECGPEGWSLWNGDVISMEPRPPALAGVTKAYAVYAKGHSMEPRYYPGELLFVNPAKPVEPGDYVVVQVRAPHEGEPPHAFIKRLVRRSGSKVTLEQHNPQKRFELKPTDILSMHLIVGASRS